MKYRINRLEDNEFDVITEDGGIASIYYNENGANTMYYQSRIKDANSMDEASEILWDSKAYIKDWGENTNEADIIADALAWLVTGEVEWERDDSIIPNYQTISNTNK